MALCEYAENSSDKIWLHLYDHFVQEKITYNKLHWNFLNFLNRSLDLVYLSDRENHIVGIGKEKLWTFRLLHKYEFFTDMRTIALGHDELFNKTFDHVFHETLNWIIDDYDLDRVYRVKISIMCPEEKAVEYRFIGREYNRKLARKLLLQNNILFNFLVTDFITINIVEIF